MRQRPDARKREGRTIGIPPSVHEFDVMNPL
jgi:hypothetical protein